jgi:hypothetical protein
MGNKRQAIAQEAGQNNRVIWWSGDPVIGKPGGKTFDAEETEEAET